MLEVLKDKVCAANIDLVDKGVVLYTWGNCSEIDRNTNLVVIKPSGVDYAHMQPKDMVVVDLITGEVVEGNLRPSSDTPTHLEIYKSFSNVGGVVHTHSVNAVAFAQAGMPISALGTTHADYFYGDIPCTRDLSISETNTEYELNTGKVIVETIKMLGISPIDVPGILVKNHGPFAFGTDAIAAVHNAVVLERVAEMAIKTLFLNSNSLMPQYILDKHFARKHGKNAYYGQNK